VRYTKCAFERRESAPGMTSFRRGKQTDYGVHLREKQKVKHHYGLMEKQFRKVFAEANKGKGNTGERLMSLLERRLDNVVYRLSFGLSRAQARLLIAHGHVTVNGRHVDVPSFVTATRRRDSRKEPPEEPTVGAVGVVPVEPRRAGVSQSDRRSAARRACSPIARSRDVSIPVQPHLIVELCSK